MRDGQYPINRILWVNISRVMSVIAKAEQLYSETWGKLESQIYEEMDLCAPSRAIRKYRSRND